MNVHRWTCDLHLGSAIVGELTYVTEVQQYRCSVCGDTVALPNCGRMSCLILLSLGCPGDKPKEVCHGNHDSRLQEMRSDEEIQGFCGHSERSPGRNKHGTHKR